MNLSEYEGYDEPLTENEVASIEAGRCGPLRHGGPCWLMPGHQGPHHCYREDIDALLTGRDDGWCGECGRLLPTTPTPAARACPDDPADVPGEVSE